MVDFLKLINLIDEVKENMTDQQYKEIVEELAVHENKGTKKFYKIVVMTGMWEMEKIIGNHGITDECCFSSIDFDKEVYYVLKSQVKVRKWTPGAILERQGATGSFKLKDDNDTLSHALMPMMDKSRRDFCILMEIKLVG